MQMPLEETRVKNRAGWNVLNIDNNIDRLKK